MTNREYLIKNTNPYDLLCRMQKNGSDCVIELITGEDQNKRCEEHESGWITNCKSCIADFLNEEKEW